ncbi:MAG: alginate export family protein [Nitrospira sp.]|nr:alginate export family protein [Nitrospira sp.]
MNVLKSITTVVAILAVAAMPAFAEKTTPATDKNSAVPAVPRAIPDLIPYHKFDPPTSKLFDISKLTISGDLRVRPEFRTNDRFGLSSHELASARAGSKRNTFFVQQWTRLGLHYTVSPDVVFFFQPQYSKNWGRGGGPRASEGGSFGGSFADANSTQGTIFARQAFMLLRNFLMPDLTVKVGRQLVVWGNHRMFGHFDWNNVGWSHDGVTANYKLAPHMTLQAGWLRVDEGNCGSPTSGGCGGTKATSDADIIYVRAPTKLMGLLVEPTYIWHSGGTGDSGADNLPPHHAGISRDGARPGDQSRHTIGGRVVKKMGMGGSRIDTTVEGYWQFGEIGNYATGRYATGRNVDIDAYAFHIDGGVTLPVPMQPRIGGEYNVASGNNPDDESEWGGFDQLYPTNHIHFGYMDRMSWKNMVHYSVGLQLRPTRDSHFEVTGHWFYLNDEKDHWYGANQNVFIQSPDGNQEDSLGKEIDVVYTMFFTPDNHVAWQIGGGVFFPGDYIDDNPAAPRLNGVEVPNTTWGYTQLWINF